MRYEILETAKIREVSLSFKVRTWWLPHIN